MSTPRVSVILPTYNRASLLGTAIDSVLAQTFRDLELIVVDDGSVDTTGHLVRRYQSADARVRYVSQENRGISAAMNAGIRESRGRYIARIDSDDKWFPELLATEVAILEARPDVGLVYAKGQWAGPDLSPLDDVLGHAPHFPGETLRSMLWGDPTCNITVVARRGCFDRAGPYDESLTASEDWDMWLRVAVYYEFHFVDRALSLVRRHDAASTDVESESFAAFIGQRHKVLDKFFARTDLAPQMIAMKAIAYRNLCVFEGSMWMAARKRTRGLRAFTGAMKTGAPALQTAARIVWFGVVSPVLAKTQAGRRLRQWDSARRLRGRTGNAAKGE